MGSHGEHDDVSDDGDEHSVEHDDSDAGRSPSEISDNEYISVGEQEVGRGEQEVGRGEPEVGRGEPEFSCNGGAVLPAAMHGLVLPAANIVNYEGNDATSSSTVRDSVTDYFPSDRAELFTWHPNRIWNAFVQFLAQLPEFSHRRTRLQGKGFHGAALLQQWARSGEAAECVTKTYSEEKKRGKRVLCQVIVWVLPGTSYRMSLPHVTRVWNNLEENDKNLWCLIGRLRNDCDIGEKINEVLQSSAQRLCSPQPIAVAESKDEAADRQMKFVGHGFQLAYNTKVGMDCPDVIKAVQSGKKGV